MYNEHRLTGVGAWISDFCGSLVLITNKVLLMVSSA